MRAFKIIARAAVSFYEELFFFFLTGLITVVCVILVIPAPFALAGIYRIAQRAVRGKGVKWSLIWEGVKEYGPRMWLVLFLVLLGYVLLVTNLWFYNSEVFPFAEQVGVWVTPIWVILTVLWSGLALYAPAFLVELKEPKLLYIFRNSLFLAILHPFQTLLYLIVTLLLLGLSIVVPILLALIPAFLAALSVTAVRTLVTDLIEKVEAEDENGTEKENQEAQGEEGTPSPQHQESDSDGT